MRSKISFPFTGRIRTHNKGSRSRSIHEKTDASYCSDEGLFVYSTNHSRLDSPSYLHSSKRASMQHSHDTMDIALLRSNRNVFILKCQPIIEIVSKNFVRSGLFAPQHLRDVIQTVNENLITRLSGIEQNYNGSVQMVTYMNAVIRNICLDIHRKERQTVQIVSLSDTEHELEEDIPLRSLLVQEEVQRFVMILTLFHHQRSKLLLCLKLFHRMPLTVHDITDCFELLPERDLTMLMSLFGKPFEEALETDIFNTIAPFMNRKENNQTSGASLRRWTQEQISRIISLLNRGKDHRTHTKETIRILLEHFT